MTYAPTPTDPGPENIEIKDFAELQTDEDRLSHYRGYLDAYFNDEFRSGQGTEHILEMISRHHVTGDWLDLGAGPASLFWSIPMRVQRSITCCDLAGEALQVLKEFVDDHRLPRCYRQVLEMFDKPPSHMDQMASGLKTFYRFDALSPWPPELADAQYDLITAMGLFGLCSTPEEYARCFAYVSPHVRPGGRLLGANWVRSPRFVEQEGHDSSYISEALVRHAASEAELEVLELGSAEVEGDPLFSRVLYWAMRPTSRSET